MSFFLWPGGLLPAVPVPWRAFLQDGLRVRCLGPSPGASPTPLTPVRSPEAARRRRAAAAPPVGGADPWATAQCEPKATQPMAGNQPPPRGPLRCHRCGGPPGGGGAEWFKQQVVAKGAGGLARPVSG